MTHGVPLPKEWQITDPRRLVVCSETGEIVPGQFRVLARWGPVEDAKLPIRWLLVDFQANVPAGKQAIYYLEDSGKTPPSFEGLRVHDGASEVAVDTGALAFTVAKAGGTLIRDVRFRGTPIGPGHDGSALLMIKGSTSFSSATDRPTVVIEEQGPLRTVIRVRGRFRNGNELFTGGDARMGTHKPEGYPLSYTFRITAYGGSTRLSLDYTLENNGNSLKGNFPVNDTYLDGSSLRLPLQLSGRIAVEGAGFRSSLQDGESLLLYQGYRTESEARYEGKKFEYQVRIGSKEVVRGRRYPGWLDISSHAGGVTVGLRHFWQNYPKSIGWQNGVLTVGILPEHRAVKEAGSYGQGNYFFNGGWHKTTHLELDIHGPGHIPAVTALFAARLEHPPVVRVDSSWISDTRAFGLIAPAGFASPLTATNEALGYYEKYQKMFVDDRFENKGRDIDMLRESRNQGAAHYGWEHFGDLAWNGGVYCALHYDWPYIMWLQFLRSGDGRFRDLAVEMTEHSADLDQIHTDTTGRYYDGIWQWENVGGKYVNYHHKSTQGAGSAMSHTWNGGYALGYLLTGNNHYREAAERSAEAGRRRWKKAIDGQKMVENQTRTQGWSILMLVNLYRITGDSKLLQEALAIFRNSLLYTEQLPESPGSGGKGYITSTGSFQKEYAGKVIVTMATYPLEPLCDLHLEAKSAGLAVDDLEAYILRSLSWLKEYAYVGGKTDSSNRYSMLTLSYATDPVNQGSNRGGTLAQNVLVAGAFGYASRILRDRDPRLADEYLDFARRLFRDLMFYRTEQKRTKDDYLDPKRRSPVGWGWLPTTTKEIGYIGRGGQAYLLSEYDLVRTSQTTTPASPKGNQP